MNIGIDARMYGLEHAGIGRYVKNLVGELANLDPTDQYTLFTRKKYQKLNLPKNFKIVTADHRHYSMAEQTKFPRLIEKEQLDLMHFPHFNVPVNYRGKFIVTIHDILWHQVRGSRVTTLNPFKYYLKYAGYRLVVRNAVRKSHQIIVPSKWVKQELIHTFGKAVDTKIHVIAEGVEGTLKLPEKENGKIILPPNFVSYVGSAYPHKNLKLLIDAILLVNHGQPSPLHLVIVGSRSIFLDELKVYVKSRGGKDYVHFLGRLSDGEVALVLKNSVALVHPSRSEGFGLTGLEAMHLGVPVISSNAACLPEIYQDAPLYFDPDDLDELVSHIGKLELDESLRREMIEKGKKVAQKYSWKQMAQDILAVYQNI